MKQKMIAQEIGVNPSTISRELNRNIAERGWPAGEYFAENAQRKTNQLKQFKPKLIKFTHSMKKQAVEWLEYKKWSPELINLEGIKTGNCPMSTESLYQWIWQSKHGNKAADKPFKKMHNLLRHGKRKRKRGSIKDSRGIIHDRVPIDKRPKVVNKLKRPGDIEVKLMMGKSHKGAFLVLNDRANLHTKLHNLVNINNNTVSKTMIKSLLKSKHQIHTISFDDDKGFADHMTVSKALNSDTYYTSPYTSKNKGTVENRIGQLRRFFPKKADLIMVTSD
jgi:IS30 family transposase